MGLVDTVKDSIGNVFSGGKYWVKRTVAFETLEFLVTAAGAFYGLYTGLNYAQSIGLSMATDPMATAGYGFAGAGLGYLAMHFFTLPFDIYHSIKTAYQSMKISLGFKPANAH